MINDNKVYVHQLKNFEYPTNNKEYNPSVKYPEYPFNSVSASDNFVYDAVRASLYHMGFDYKNYNTTYWNPLKQFIKPNDTVLIKPNLVLHESKKKLEPLVTHPSLLRAIIDYVYIANNGENTIIIGDAPLQSCDFDKLLNDGGYNIVINFYKQLGIKIKVVDFRNYYSKIENGVHKVLENDKRNASMIVDLKDDSEFANINADQYSKLRITNYDHSILLQHHNKEKHEYSIAKEVLEADFIINMPKPKTHRKAGVTISLKNLVGINTNKEWLPHHTIGSKNDGGDEYKNKSIIKKCRTALIEKRDKYMVTNNKKEALFYNNCARILFPVMKIFCKDKYTEGSWYGNDTIWRTILDLNKILFFCNNTGKMNLKKQREMLIIGDMVVSGEKEGPLMPTPKKAGIVVTGRNPVCFDEAVASIMGFDFKKIPSINNAKKLKNYSYFSSEETEIYSNNPQFNFKKPKEICRSESLKFEPSLGWYNCLLNKKMKGNE